jgi:hypothetical protein
MNTPTALRFIDTSSSSTHPSSSDTTIPKDTAPPIGSAANGPSLWRSIIDTHGKEILECASDQFLDLATALRLETINARDLVDLLAKAGRPRYIETDIVEGNAGERLDHEARGPRLRLDANSASTLPGQKTGQGRSASSTPSPQPSPVQASREPKRQKIDERHSVGVNGLPVPKPIQRGLAQPLSGNKAATMCNEEREL